MQLKQPTVCYQAFTNHELAVVKFESEPVGNFVTIPIQL